MTKKGKFSKSFYLKHILTPSTEKILFGKELLEPLLRKENITVLSLPHNGIRKKMNYFINKIDSFGQILDKKILIYLDPNELSENTPCGYFRLMTNLIDNKKINSQDPLLGLRGKSIKYLNLGYRLIFIFGYFDKLNYPTTFFNNLFGLHQINRQKVSFIFSFSRNILTEENLGRFGELRELLLQNIVYFPVLDYDDALFVLRNLSLKYGYPISEDKEKLIISLAGGHPVLLKLCLRALADCPKLERQEVLEYVSQKPEIKLILENIWASFTSEEKSLILEKIRGNSTIESCFFDHLKNLKLISENHLFSSLLDIFIKDKESTATSLQISEKEKQILIKGKPPKSKISGRDYKLLVAFSKKPGRIITRDEIAEILWDKLSYDKYSDWAIDRAIFSLRKRLQDFGVSPEALQTVKGLGYRLVF